MRIQGIKNALMTAGDNVPIVVVGDDIKSTFTHGINHLLAHRKWWNASGDIRSRLLVIDTRIKGLWTNSGRLGDQVGID